MDNAYTETFIIQGGNFHDAGKAATHIKSVLKQLGIDPSIIRRVAIASYEAEMNVVMYAKRAVLTFQVTPKTIRILLDDEGPGIPDITMAMQEGFSTATQEMREMGFGAGMGLPNIKRNSDDLKISSIVGQGTKLEFTININ